MQAYLLQVIVPGNPETGQQADGQVVIMWEVAEAHGGYLSLTNHADRPGCRALLRLPIERQPQHAP